MAARTHEQPQQWRKYNPLDRKAVETKHEKTNKYPFCKTEESTTVESMLKPKVSSLGVLPFRSTAFVGDLEVMLVGKAAIDTVKQENMSKEENGDKEPDNIENLKPSITEDKPTKKREKMPAIIASVGTTANVTFTKRKKRKQMPKTRLKMKMMPKLTEVAAPPNSRMSKPASSAHSLTHSTSISSKHDDQHSEAPPSSPVEKEASVPNVRDTSSARSVDDIIKSLRTSREGPAARSSSDVRIDELLKQVMFDADEWNEKDGEILEEKDTEGVEMKFEDEDIPDTVSTLASQISAPAGIPDVALILLRRSSETAQRAGGGSSTGSSSPILGIGDLDDYVDREQAIRDLNRTLDVTNEDIICVKGLPPPVIKLEVSEDEGYFDSSSLSGSSSSRQLPEVTSTVTTGGRIHHLCLIAADKISNFDVEPSNALMSRLMHAPGQYRAALESENVLRRKVNRKITKDVSLPPAPPPSQAVQFITNGSEYEHQSENGGTSKLNSVLEEVEQYNQQALRFGNVTPVTSDLHPKPSDIELDTSKIDPLDLDKWRKLADTALERDDFTQQGHKYVGRESNIWRLVWTPAPPKMLIPPVAVKSVLFPHYHGTQLAVGSSAGDKDEIDTDEFDSEIEEENDQQESSINQIYLFRKHKSEQDLPSAVKRQNEDGVLRRSRSIPDLREDTSDVPFIKIKADYSLAMEELGKQRLAAMAQEQIQFQPNAATLPVPAGSPTKLDLRENVAKRQPVDKLEDIFTVTSLPPEKKVSHAEMDRQGGREYIERRKSRRKLMKKKASLVFEARRFLSYYEPQPLKRSRSAETGLPAKLLLRIHEEEPKDVPISRTKRCRSVPREIHFGEFVDRHRKMGEDVGDMREWVRDIWNVWFDELYPPPESEDDSWSTSSSEMEEVDVEDPAHPAMKSSKPQSGTASTVDKPKLPTKIPDILPPIVVRLDDDEMTYDEDLSVEMMQKEVGRLQNKILELSPHETATHAILLAQQGAVLRKLGHIKSAEDSLNQAISIEPHLGAAYWHRHLIRLLQNKYHDALDDLNALLKLNKQHVHAYRSRADIFALLGDFTMAIVNYTQAIKFNPTDENAFYQRAQLYEKKGDMLLALEDYASVVRINPSRTDALLKRGRYNFANKNWHTTIADFTLMIQREPHNALARTYRGRAYAAVKQYESALMDLSAAIHLDPMNWRAFYHRGCLLRSIAPEKSLLDFSCSLLIEDSYDNSMALLHRGILYTELKRFKEAVVDFEEALRLDHGLACAHVNIGLVHHQITQNYLEAIKHFTNAIKVDPTYSRAYMCRSDAYEQNGEHKRALYDVTRAIVLCPGNRHLYLRRGQLLLRLGELELAAFCVRHIATLGEGIVSTSATQQAVVQSFLKNHDKAVESLTTASRVKPLPSTFILLGKTLMKAKKFAEAIISFNNALESIGTYTASTITAASSVYTDSSKLNPNLDESFEVHFLLGECFTQLEQDSQALQSYNQALKANPNFALAYYRRGLCRLKLDHSKGVQDLNRALALDSTLFEAYLSRAAFYGIKKRYSKAILNCNEALRLQPRSIRAFLYRGALKFHIGAYLLAVQDLTSALKLDHACSLAYFNRAVCYQRMKKYKDAIKDYSIVLMLEDSSDKQTDVGTSSTSTTSPLRLRVYVNRGLLYLRDLGDAHNAALDFESVISIQPRDIRVLHTMALCYHQLKLLNAAVKSYTLSIQVDPFFLAGYIGRGDAHADSGDVVASRRDYQRALKLDPTCVSARVNLGYSLQSIGKLYQAWLQFTRAIELDSRCQQALEGRAVTCLLAGNIEAAFQDVSRAFRAGKPTARLHTARGVIHQYMGDVYNAMADYQRAIKLDENYSTAFFNAAALYLRDRRFQDALAYLDKCLQLNQEDASALLNRGISRILLNDTKNALKDFDDAVKLNDKNAHAFYNRGNLLSMLKRYEEAEKDYTTAFTIDPSDYGALKKRADVRGKLDRKEEAIADYRDALEIFEKKTYLESLAK